MEARRAICAFSWAFYPWTPPTLPVIAPQPVLLAFPSLLPTISETSEAPCLLQGQQRVLNTQNWRTWAAEGPCVCGGDTFHSPHSSEKGEPVSTILASASKFRCGNNSLRQNSCILSLERFKEEQGKTMRVFCRDASNQESILHSDWTVHCSSLIAATIWILGTSNPVLGASLQSLSLMYIRSLKLFWIVLVCQSRNRKAICKSQ